MKKGFSPLILVIILAIVGIVGINYIRNQSFTPVSQQEQNEIGQINTFAIYEDEIEGYRIGYPQGYRLSYLPLSNSEGHTYGVFETEERQRACLDFVNKNYVLFSKDNPQVCMKDMFTINLTGITNEKFLSDHADQIEVNRQDFTDKEGRDWIFTDIEVSGVYRASGYLQNKKNKSWNLVMIESWLGNGSYPEYMEPMRNLSRQLIGLTEYNEK